MPIRGHAGLPACPSFFAGAAVLVLAAEPVAELVELRVHLLLVLDMSGGLRIELGKALPLPLDVRRHTGPLDGHAVRLTVSGPARPRVVAWRLGVAALQWIPGAECVAEHPRRLVRHERVLAPPARPVPRREGVEVDESSVLVQPGAVLTRLEAVDGLPLVCQPSEDVVEPATPRPVGVALQRRGRTGPMREVERPCALRLHPGQETEVGQRALPALKRPV